MDPMAPEVRRALKEANPGLTDEEIDRSEELLAQLQFLDPSDAQQEAEFARLESEFRDLVGRRMPRYDDVIAAANRRRVRQAAVQRPTPQVTVKRDRSR